MISLLAAVVFHQLPSLQYRWVYVQTNLQVEEQVNKIIDLMKRAKRDGYNGIVVADGKLQRLATVPDWYFKNAKKLIDACKQERMDLIPCVFPVGYAEGMLANDPNLVEGIPVKGAPFVVHGAEAQLAPSPGETYRNGDMEAANGNQLAGMAFQDSVGVSTFIDTEVKHGGRQSLRMTDPIVGMPQGGNSRVTQEVTVTPHRQYHVSAWVKTQDFDRAGNFAIRVFDPQMKLLTTQDVRVKPTQDWSEVHVTFNSGAATKARVYIGVWDGNKGSLWLDDVKFEQVGLLNVIRRDSCPVRVTSESGILYEEGRDYEKIVDSKMGQVPWAGAFEVYHPAPPIRIPSGSRINDGQRLLVDFDHALITTDNQAAICMSDRKTYEIEQDEANRIEALFHPKGFFLSHDEIRAANQDSTCLAHGLDAGALFAENFRKSFNAVQKAHPGAETYVWNDMFDPFHNAHKDYYNVRGDITGSWQGVPKQTVIVNWYYAARAKNLPFFGNGGWRQILAGYYDHDPGEIRQWLADSKGIKGVVGVMYTTWVSNYDDLEKFAAAAWGKP